MVFMATILPCLRLSMPVVHGVPELRQGDPYCDVVDERASSGTVTGTLRESNENKRSAGWVVHQQCLAWAGLCSSLFVAVAGAPRDHLAAGTIGSGRRRRDAMTDPAYPDALPAQSRLHWYVVERVLGQGGFGITYLARDTNLDRPVAIKEYLPVDAATRMPDATIRARTDELRDRYRWGLERFIQEARTLARFDHPNIVHVHSVFEFNNTAYMVMRFESGVTLAALLDRRGTLPEDELLRIILPVLDGLELVHNAGFIHRDIKPDNIHIDDDGDAGSARLRLGAPIARRRAHVDDPRRARLRALRAVLQRLGRARVRGPTSTGSVPPAIARSPGGRRSMRSRAAKVYSGARRT